MQKPQQQNKKSVYLSIKTVNTLGGYNTLSGRLHAVIDRYAWIIRKAQAENAKRFNENELILIFAVCDSDRLEESIAGLQISRLLKDVNKARVVEGQTPPFGKEIFRKLQNLDLLHVVALIESIEQYTLMKGGEANGKAK